MAESVKSLRLRSVILTVVTLGLIVAFLYYLYINVDKYNDLLRVSPAQVFALFGVSLAFPLINGFINTYLFRSMGANISYQHSFLLTAASTLANQLPISGGIISKGFYLKRKYDVSYTKSFSATLALFFCFIATDGLIGMMILVYWALFNNIVVPPILLFGFASMTSCFFIFWMPVHRIRLSGKIHKWICEVVDGWSIINRSPALLLNLVGLQTILMFLSAINYWLSFHMLSQDVSLSESMLFATASMLTQVVGVAPGGLGIREAIVGAIASTLGFDLGVSVVAVGLERLVSTFTIILVGGISTVILGKQIYGLPAKTEKLKDVN